MSTIFMSYRRVDSKHATSRIHDRLRHEFGRDFVFKDVDSIPIGTDFREVLRDVLGACQVTLVMITPTWVTTPGEDGKPRFRLMNPTDFVRLELEATLSRGIPVVPVLLDGARLPLPEELPPSLRPICFRHAISVGDDPHFEDDISRLIRGIGKLVESKPAPMVSPKPLESEEEDQGRASYEKGWAYYHGSGVPQDYVKARGWWTIAALQGYAEAQCGLGVLYHNSYGVPQDYAKAREWFEKAAIQGFAIAQYYLGDLYECGQGIPKSVSEALKWYLKAAENGHDKAKLKVKELEAAT